MRTESIVVAVGLVASSCMPHAASLVRGDGGKIIGGVMFSEQGSAGIRDRVAAEHEMYEACDNEATVVREWDGVQSLGYSTAQNAHFFEFQCGKVEVGYRERKIREAREAARKEKNADPCSDQNKAEMRASGMPESAIERACN